MWSAELSDNDTAAVLYNTGIRNLIEIKQDHEMGFYFLKGFPECSFDFSAVASYFKTGP